MLGSYGNILLSILYIYFIFIGKVVKVILFYNHT